MALVSVNAPRSSKGDDSTMDKILKAVKIAEGVTGLAMVVPKILQEKKKAADAKEQADREHDLNVGKVTTAAYKAGFRPVAGVSAPETTQRIDLRPQETRDARFGITEPEGEPQDPMMNRVSVMGQTAPLEGEFDVGVEGEKLVKPRGAIEIPGLEGYWAGGGTGGGKPLKLISMLQKTLPYDEEQEYPQGAEVVDFGGELGTRVVPPDPTQLRADERATRMAGYTAIGVRRGSSAVLGKSINRGKLAGNAMVLINAAREGVKGYAAQDILDDPAQMQGKSVEEINELRELAKHKFVPTEQFTYDLAMSLAAIMGGGNQPAYAMVEHMVPGNARADYKKLVQWVTAKPQEYLNDKFLDHFEEAMQRELWYWGEQRDNMIAGIAHFMDPVFTRRKDLYESFKKGVKAAFHTQGNAYETWLQKNYKYKDTHKEHRAAAMQGSALSLPTTDWYGEDVGIRDGGMDHEKLLQIANVFNQSGTAPLQIDSGDLMDALDGLE